jgi:hypothetical protein
MTVAYRVTALPTIETDVGYSSFYGFGAITPTTLKGVTIRQLYQYFQQVPGYRFYVQVSSVVTQDFWTSLTLNPGTTIYSGDATTFATQSTPVIFSTWTFDGYYPGWTTSTTSATATFTY